MVKKQTAFKDTSDPKTDTLLSRRKLALRWECHTKTVKRRARTGLIPEIVIGTRTVRYRLSDILRAEAASLVLYS